MILAFLAGSGCASKKSLSSGGGGGGTRPASIKPGPLLVEVRGYVLAPSDSVPPDAIGYAVPIFTSREQAKNFCAGFIGRLSFGGRLDSNVKLQVRTYGQTVQIAPFVWPVTSWTTGDKADCVSLVARYNLSGAQIFYKLAVDAIRANGGRPSDALSQGPFIVTARRVSGTTMIYDLSRAPDNDYEKWLVRAAEQLTDPSLSRQTYVKPRWRDRMRYYVFGSISTFQGIVDVLIPGFSKEHERI